MIKEGVLTSKYVKELMLDRYGWLACVASAHELPNLNNADFIVVKYGGVIQEYEIKISRADLIGEMRCARVAKGLVDASEFYQKKFKFITEGDKADVHKELANKHGHGTSLSRTKLEKHRLYLRPNEREVKPTWARRDEFVPNTFYWCIPEKLLAICLELNQGLPYGIYVFDSPKQSNNHSYATTFIHHRATSLKPQGKAMYHMANRLHTLLCEARDKIKRLEAEGVNE